MTIPRNALEAIDQADMCQMMFESREVTTVFVVSPDRMRDTYLDEGPDRWYMDYYRDDRTLVMSPRSDGDMPGFVIH